MKYQATFRHVRIYIGFLTLISVGAMMMGALVVHSATLVVGGVGALMYICAMRFTRSITFTEAGFEFGGIIRHWSISWSDVKTVKRLQNCSWPINRMFGPFTYEIQTVQGRRIINFLFFPSVCFDEFKERLHRVAGRAVLPETAAFGVQRVQMVGCIMLKTMNWRTIPFFLVAAHTLLLLLTALAMILSSKYSHNVDSSIGFAMMVITFFIIDFPIGALLAAHPQFDNWGGQLFLYGVLGNLMWFMLGVVVTLVVRLVFLKSSKR
jgi:hypothetical protein